MASLVGRTGGAGCDPGEGRRALRDTYPRQAPGVAPGGTKFTWREAASLPRQDLLIPWGLGTLPSGAPWGGGEQHTGEASPTAGGSSGDGGTVQGP